MTVGIGPLSGSVRRSSPCNQRAIPVFGSHLFPISLCRTVILPGAGNDKLCICSDVDERV